MVLFESVKVFIRSLAIAIFFHFLPQCQGCQAEWKNFVNMHSFGALLLDEVRSSSDCLNYCLVNATCIAVEVDNNFDPIKCWMYDDASKITSRYPALGLDQYVLIARCSDTPCAPEWNAFPSTNSFGGIQYPQYTTVDDCLALCISLPQCVAVDVNNSSGNSIQCFVHNSTSKIAVKNSFTGINQYVLVSRCVNSTTASSCRAKWDILPNTNSFGGSEYQQYTTVDDCLNFCISLTQCIAVDINNSSADGVFRCFVHNSSANVANKNPFIGINQYVLASRCESSSSTSSSITTTQTAAYPVCVPSWSTKPQVHSLQGVLYSNCSSQQLCLGCCLSMSQCVGVDVDTFFYPASCFVYTNPGTFAAKYDSTTVIQYQLINRCMSPTACNAPGFHYCRDGNQCFPSSSFCDGVLDCIDNSDEFECTSVCAANQFPCGSNAAICLLNLFWCNGIEDCPDGYDEPHGCQRGCSPTAHRCSDDYVCISKDRLCNGIRDCPDGSDESNCTSACPLGTFSCSGRSRCRGLSSWCNGAKDCDDASDEAPDCLYVCPADYVRCWNTSAFTGSGCISVTQWCDGVSLDCADGSDEYANCVCGGSSHRCPHGCISHEMVCDGLLQCSDGSDEANCSCDSDFFKCANSACISKYSVCDGLNDCGDFSDELICGGCNRLEFSCFGLCLNYSSVCDGYVDCPQGEDEENCTYACDVDQFACDGVRCLSNALVCNNIFDCLDLNDELHCSSICSDNRGVVCSNGLCLLPYQWCDDHVDCSDQSDEKYCQCSPPDFKCLDGLCIRQAQLCDGIYDCADRDDEFDCACSRGEYACPQSNCISEAAVCDGVSDCPDGGDENACGVQCSSSEFQCESDYSCITSRQMCNGVVDCNDGSDENICLSFRSVSAELSAGPLLIDPVSPTPLVIRLSGSRSYHVCVDGWSSSWSDAACQKMGYIRSNTTKSDTNDRNYPTVVVSGDSGSSNLLSSVSVSSCPSNRYVLTNCVVKGCGVRIVSENLFGTYIASGAAAQTGAHPWHVAIFKNNRFLCSGSLIDDQWVLTSAQCLMEQNSLQKADISEYAVRMGSAFLSSYDANLQVGYPSQFVIHPQFNNFTHEGDVGLMRLSGPVPIMDGRRPICLPDNSTNVSFFKVCMSSGWSRQNLGEQIVTDALTQERMSILSKTQCSQLLRVTSNARPVQHDSILCGHNPTVATNVSCLTDIGRPLICKDGADIWTQIGLATVDTVCGGASLFTKLSDYVDWIQNSIQR